jgi:hypothetical protein
MGQEQVDVTGGVVPKGLVRHIIELTAPVTPDVVDG